MNKENNTFMNSAVNDILKQMQQCDSFHDNCDCLLDNNECDYLLDYIKKLEEENKKLNEEIQHIKNDNMRLATSKNVRYTYGLR